MFRRLITMLCLLLLLAVVASWVRSLFASESYTMPVAQGFDVVARHAQGAFTILCGEARVVLSMPHWVAATLLGVWPLVHLRVRLQAPKPAKKR